MGVVRETMRRVRSFFEKRRQDSELDVEIATHLELAVEENMRQGIPRDEARRQALIRFGGVQQAKERQRESRGLPWLDALLQDVPLYAAHVAQGPLLYAGCRADSGAGDWREYRRLQRGEYDSAAAAAVSASREVGPHLDEASHGW